MILLVSGQPELEMDPEVFRRCSRAFAAMLMTYQKKLDGISSAGNVEEFDRAASLKAWVSSCVVLNWFETLNRMTKQDDILFELNQLCDRYRLSAFKDIDSLKGPASNSFTVTYVGPQALCGDGVYIQRSADFFKKYAEYDLSYHYQADVAHQRAGLYDPKDVIADEIVKDVLFLLDDFDVALVAIEAGMDWQP